jgi:hypothetical protein
VPFAGRIGAEGGARKERAVPFCQHFYRKTQNGTQTIARQAFMFNVFLEAIGCNLHLSVKKTLTGKNGAEGGKSVPPTLANVSERSPNQVEY